MRPKGTAEELETRRRRAPAMLEDGWWINQVAAHFGVSRRSVSQWRRAHLVFIDETGLSLTPSFRG